MQNFNIEELIGEFESIEEQELKIDDLKSQIKMITADNNQRFKEFAKNKETKDKYIKQLYKHWKEQKESEDREGDNEDLYTLMAILDMYFEKEEESDTHND